MTNWWRRIKEALKKAVGDEDYSLYNIINQWIINKKLTQQQESKASIQLHNINNFEDITHKRIKSSIESNACNTALSDKTNIIASAPLEGTYENQESKTLRRCKN